MSKSKYEAYRKVSSLRVLEKTEANYFKLYEKTVSRAVLEGFTVKQLKKAMSEGALYTARIKPEKKVKE